MSCLVAETPLPAVIDQLEKHKKELYYPSHLLNVGNSLGQEALGTVPNFPTVLRGSFHQGHNNRVRYSLVIPAW